MPSAWPVPRTTSPALRVGHASPAVSAWTMPPSPISSRSAPRRSIAGSIAIRISPRRSPPGAQRRQRRCRHPPIAARPAMTIAPSVSSSCAAASRSLPIIPAACSPIPRLRSAGWAAAVPMNGVFPQHLQQGSSRPQEKAKRNRSILITHRRFQRSAMPEPLSNDTGSMRFSRPCSPSPLARSFSPKVAMQKIRGAWGGKKQSRLSPLSWNYLVLLQPPRRLAGAGKSGLAKTTGSSATSVGSPSVRPLRRKS